MNILIVSATYAEIHPFLSGYFPGFREENTFSIQEYQNLTLHVLITGVGGMQAAFHLTKLLSGGLRPDLTLFCGIAGEISRTAGLGEVYLVNEEAFSDLGAFDEAGHYTDVWDLGLIAADRFPFVDRKLFSPAFNAYNFMPKVAGITSNMVTSSTGGLERIRRYFPESRLETMENAYLFYVAIQFGISFLSIRSTSNYVGERNKENWQLSSAVQHLNHVLEEMLESLTELEDA